MEGSGKPRKGWNVVWCRSAIELPPLAAEYPLRDSNVEPKTKWQFREELHTATCVMLWPLNRPQPKKTDQVRTEKMKKIESEFGPQQVDRIPSWPVESSRYVGLAD